MISWELAVLLLVIVFIIIIMVWWLWELTKPPQTISTCWTARLLQSDRAEQQVFGRIWLDPEHVRLNYLLNIQNVHSIVRRAYMRIDPEHPNYDPEFKGKELNHSFRNGLLVLAGHWDRQDIHIPLNKDYIACLYDQGWQIIITTDNKPNGEMIVGFENSTPQTLDDGMVPRISDTDSAVD